MNNLNIKGKNCIHLGKKYRIEHLCPQDAVFFKKKQVLTIREKTVEFNYI